MSLSVAPLIWQPHHYLQQSNELDLDVSFQKAQEAALFYRRLVGFKLGPKGAAISKDLSAGSDRL